MLHVARSGSAALPVFAPYTVAHWELCLQSQTSLQLPPPDELLLVLLPLPGARVPVQVPVGARHFQPSLAVGLLAQHEPRGHTVQIPDSTPQRTPSPRELQADELPETGQSTAEASSAQQTWLVHDGAPQWWEPAPQSKLPSSVLVEQQNSETGEPSPFDLHVLFGFGRQPPPAELVQYADVRIVPSSQHAASSGMQPSPHGSVPFLQRVTRPELNVMGSGSGTSELHASDNANANPTVTVTARAPPARFVRIPQGSRLRDRLHSRATRS